MAFLNKNRIDLPGKSEYVFSLPYDILKKVLCLLILVFHVRHMYLTDVPVALKQKIHDLFSGVTYLAIRSGGVLYQHQERLLTHAIDLDKPGQEVIVVWGEHKDHPEWEHRIFIGTLQESSKPVKNKRSIRWIDANFMDTQDVPLEWIYVKNNKILAQPERTLNLDQFQEIQENNKQTTQKSDTKNHDAFVFDSYNFGVRTIRTCNRRFCKCYEDFSTVDFALDEKLRFYDVCYRTSKSDLTSYVNINKHRRTL